MFRLSLLLCLSLICLSGCTSLKEPRFIAIADIDASGVKLSGKSTLTAFLTFHNPNKKRGTLSNAKGDVFINNKNLGHFYLDAPLSIPSNQDFTVPVKMDLDLSKIFNSLSILLNPEVEIRVEGNARAGINGIYKNFPLIYKGRQDITQLIKTQ